jgi:hypothetical protein
VTTFAWIVVGFIGLLLVLMIVSWIEAAIRNKTRGEK